MNIGPVIRGAGLPNSVSPGRTATVEVTIDPPLVGQHVTLEIVPLTANSGSATILDNPQLSATGVIQVRGVQQSSPAGRDQPNGLKILALLNSQPVAESPTFWACAHPEAVEYELLGEAAIDRAVGMSVSVTLVADSGNTAHLNEVMEKELVSDPYAHSENLGGIPQKRPNQNMHFKPAHTVPPDNHTVPIAQSRVMDRDKLHGQLGCWSHDQLDLFGCKRCAMTKPVPIRRSGYRIIRTVFTEAGQILALVRKEPKDVLIDGLSSEAGPSPIMELTLPVPEYPGELPPPVN